MWQYTVLSDQSIHHLTSVSASVFLWWGTTPWTEPGPKDKSLINLNTQVFGLWEEKGYLKKPQEHMNTPHRKAETEWEWVTSSLWDDRSNHWATNHWVPLTSLNGKLCTYGDIKLLRSAQQQSEVKSEVSSRFKWWGLQPIVVLRFRTWRFLLRLFCPLRCTTFTLFSTTCNKQLCLHSSVSLEECFCVDIVDVSKNNSSVNSVKSILFYIFIFFYFAVLSHLCPCPYS